VQLSRDEIQVANRALHQNFKRRHPEAANDSARLEFVEDFCGAANHGADKHY
jgi:hypothetical protein